MNRSPAAKPLAIGSVPAAPEVWPAELTGAQREVAALLIAGATYREIAKRRDVSPHTVNSQVAKMLRQLGVASTSELIVLLARRNSCRKT